MDKKNIKQKQIVKQYIDSRTIIPAEPGIKSSLRVQDPRFRGDDDSGGVLQLSYRGLKYYVCIASAIISLMISFNGNSFGMDIFNHEPTVTVIDEETGKPIEGAVAIAIWREHSTTQRAWWEGGTMVVVRIEEEVSDSNGNIYIDDFWDWHVFENRYPRLTIYKPGYVCWDQKNIYIDEFHAPLRTDFDEKHRIAKMKKWPEGFSFVGHESFVNGITHNYFTHTPKQLFNKAFDYETSFTIKENTERDKKRKEMEEEKKRREAK